MEPRRPRRSEAKARARLAPAAPKPEVAEVDPNTHIAVFGDRLADLLGEGLEEAYDEEEAFDVEVESGISVWKLPLSKPVWWSRWA